MRCILKAPLVHDRGFLNRMAGQFPQPLFHRQLSVQNYDAAQERFHFMSFNAPFFRKNFCLYPIER